LLRVPVFHQAGLHLGRQRSPDTLLRVPRQKLGQHFLADAGWREKIARAIGISEHSVGGRRKSNPNTCWIEIGGGHGEMTRHLAACGWPVHVIELDPSLARRLQDLRTEFPNIEVVHTDVLQADLRTIAAGHRANVYGNLPYYITSPILHHLFAFADLIEEIHIVIQIEVAFRLVARPGTRDYGYLSALTQYFSRPAIALKLPPGAFRPPPKVGSALVSLRLPGERAKLDIENDHAFLEFVKLCFAQKRKTLINNLRDKSEPERTRHLLEQMRLRLDARAEQLSVSQLAELFRKFNAP
jgi:16S rRNA (adenine1518-N6/adenine1519-N6)-dimethyltransferase